MRVSRRRTGGGAFLVAAALAGLLASGCGGSAASAVDPVAQAADATSRAGGAQVALSGAIGTAGLPRPLALSGSGQFNFGAGEGTFTMSMSGLPASAQRRLHGSALQILEVFKAGAVYISSPVFAGKLPSGARWLKIDVAQVQRAMGIDTSSFASGTDPTQYLKDLRGAGASVKVAAHESVRGVPTTRYDATIDLVKAAESEAGAKRAQARAAVEKLIAKTGQASMPVKVWVDAHGLVRRIGMDLAEKPGGRTVTASLQIEYFGFGATHVATPPPSSEVFDATGQAIQRLGSG